MTQYQDKIKKLLSISLLLIKLIDKGQHSIDNNTVDTWT